ncbi:MAG TPA: hypothetical protein VNS79_15400 [Sphingobium sp.]|nr:hypothetical protein [Sphingobium sp.]
MTEPIPDPTDKQIAARARAGIDQARLTAGKALAATRRKGEAVIEDTREKGFRAAAETNRLFYEHPVAAVAAAAAAGAVLGIFLPRTALAGKAGRVAGQALKVAVASETAQALWQGLMETRNVALTKAAGKAASAVGDHLGARRQRALPTTAMPALPTPAPDAADEPDDAPAA